ncbi:MAG: phosphonate ABC transporter ATP-binding protein [Phycisphaerales bacterium]|nr:phosphonate ABC transporter ATP-binding protein [Phycisphaerales bacterium]
MSRTRDILIFDRVSSGYPGTPGVLKEVSFTVPEGQFCVVLGPSGAGKSTMLRLVVGMAPQIGGRVVFDDQAVGPRSMRKIRSRVGFVHQRFDLVPRLSVVDNVLSGAAVRQGLWRTLLKWHPRDLRRKACRLLASVGLEESQLYRRASSLSGGQQQRVAIARAFILDPSLVLADEPVASLDPETSRGVLSLLRARAAAGNCAVLCSLHQVELVREFADRVIAVRGGNIVFDGSASSLDDDAVRSLYGSVTLAEPKQDRPARRESNPHAAEALTGAAT